MKKMGVRASASIFAMLAVTLAVVAGTALLLTTLRQSLIAEVDRSILSRADDIAEQWDSENDFIILGAGFDGFTFAAVFDDSYYASTEDTIDPQDLRDATIALGEPFTANIALPGVEGTDELRSIVLLAEDSGLIDPDGDIEIDELDVLVFVGSSLSPVDSTVQRVFLGASLVGPIFVLLVGLLTWFLTGRSLRPVEAIRNEVESITASGLDRRVPEPAAGDEVGRLAGTMNRMLARLETSQRAQQQFVSDASHELRSPLTSMSAMLEVAERHGTADDWHETAGDLQRETDRMRRLVDDLLLLARSDSSADGQPGIAGATQAMVDVDDVVLDVIRTAATRPEVTIDASRVSAGLVYGNRDQLRRVVINLISNAARHATSTVTVSLAELDGVVTLTVDDDGAGIPIEQRAHIFDRFVRLDEARGRDAGGSGLGLAIAKEIVAAHGGSIEVGTSLLGGARFAIELPQR